MPGLELPRGITPERLALRRAGAAALDGSPARAARPRHVDRLEGARIPRLEARGRVLHPAAQHERGHDDEATKPGLLGRGDHRGEHVRRRIVRRAGEPGQRLRHRILRTRRLVRRDRGFKRPAQMSLPDEGFFSHARRCHDLDNARWIKVVAVGS